MSMPINLDLRSLNLLLSSLFFISRSEYFVIILSAPIVAMILPSDRVQSFSDIFFLIYKSVRPPVLYHTPQILAIKSLQKVK